MLIGTQNIVNKFIFKTNILVVQAPGSQQLAAICVTVITGT